MQFIAEINVLDCATENVYKCKASLDGNSLHLIGHQIEESDDIELSLLCMSVSVTEGESGQLIIIPDKEAGYGPTESF